MKSIFIAIIAFFIFTGCLQGQTRNDVKLYAYKQPVIGGAPPRTTITENGQPLESNNTRSRNNYLIYLEASPSIRVIPVELWIEGENYGVSSTDVKQTPVESASANPGEEKATVLVPKTNNKVVQLNLRPLSVSKSTAAAKSASQANQVVVVYKVGSSFYHAVVQDLIMIEPVVLQ
ncbi:MAG: hypothetical protein M3413_03085 [Bacteroidota bacterium]|jgi:hypothetical protein|nr:hypothetical protein [Bacteroidota bacterium]